MSMIDAHGGRGDEPATKADLALLGGELRAEFTVALRGLGERLDARVDRLDAKIDAGIDRLDAKIDRGLWAHIGLTVALAVALVGVPRLL